MPTKSMCFIHKKCGNITRHRIRDRIPLISLQPRPLGFAPSPHHIGNRDRASAIPFTSPDPKMPRTC